MSPTTSPARLAHIVVGADGSPESRYALSLAAAMGAGPAAALTVVHVRPRPATLAFSSAAAVEHAQSEDELAAMLRAEAAEQLTGYPGEWSVVVRSGRNAVAREILAVADEVDADLVVVGHRSNGPLRDVILGSVATGIVHHSRRSALVAIPPAPATAS